VRAEKTGFKTAVRKGVNLEVGQEAVVNLRLEVGELAQQIVITEEARSLTPPPPASPASSASAK